MRAFTIVIFCFILSFSTDILLADDSLIATDIQDKPRLMSPSNPAHQKMAESNVDIHSAIEEYDRAKLASLISLIKNDADGRISQVSYSNGDVAAYSYGINADGTLNTINISTSSGLAFEFSTTTEGLQMKFSLAAPAYTTAGDTDGDGEVDEIDIDQIYKEAKRIYKPVLIIVYTGKNKPEDLEEIAHNPIQPDYFKKVKDALDDFAKGYDEAEEDYQAKQDEYYRELYADLLRKRDTLKSEGIDISVYFAEASSGQSPIEETKRDIVKKAVTYIRSESSKSKTRKTEAERFLDLEKAYSENLLMSGKDIRDNRIKESLVYLKNIIEKLNRSGLALYFKANKDKIEAIVDLQQI